MDPQILAGGGFAILAAGFLIRWVTTLVENHLTHLTQEVREMKEAIVALTEALRPK